MHNCVSFAVKVFLLDFCWFEFLYAVRDVVKWPYKTFVQLKLQCYCKLISKVIIKSTNMCFSTGVP
jgi:hypothetical protein